MFRRNNEELDFYQKEKILELAKDLENHHDTMFAIKNLVEKFKDCGIKLDHKNHTLSFNKKTISLPKRYEDNDQLGYPGFSFLIALAKTCNETQIPDIFLQSDKHDLLDFVDCAYNHVENFVISQ
ncbi:MAG: hypothetical protein ACTSVV_14240 [Promethearchaeota archaeon]